MATYNIPEDDAVGDPEHTERHRQNARATNDLDRRVSALEAGGDDLIALTPVMVVYGTDLDMARPATERICQWYGQGRPNNANAGDIIMSNVPLVDGGSFVGILDGTDTPFRAHALRKLSGMYTGKAIRVLRSSDQTEKDIGFTPEGDLDENELLAFAGSGSAHVVSLYDQSGNGRHLYAPGASAARPRIVLNGVIDKINGKPAMYFDGVANILEGNEVGLYEAGVTSILMVHAINPASASSVFGEYGPTSANSYRVPRIGAGASSPLLRVSATVQGTTPFSFAAVSGDTTFDGNPHHVCMIDTSSSFNAWRDTLSVIASTYERSANANLVQKTGLGASAYTTRNGFAQGYVQELIAWTSSILAMRLDLTANQRTYWGLT